MQFSLKFLQAALPPCVAELNPEIFSCESAATNQGFVTSAVVQQLLKVGRGEQKNLPGILVRMIAEVLTACSSYSCFQLNQKVFVDEVTH